MEKAIEKATKEFNIPPSLRSRIDRVVQGGIRHKIRHGIMLLLGSFSCVARILPERFIN